MVKTPKIASNRTTFPMRIIAAKRECQVIGNILPLSASDSGSSPGEAMGLAVISG